MDADSRLNVIDFKITRSQNPSETFLDSLITLIAIKDKATHAHSMRVYDLVIEWSSYMLSRSRWTHLNLKALRTSALFHDVGKLGVLDEVLLKPGALDREERNLLEQHSELGYQMLRDFPGITEVAEGVRFHHERFDGRGYPLGLKGKQIPEIARIICIADAYDAMTSDRPYRMGRSSTEALAEIEREAGQHFCPDLTADFLQFMHARRT